MLPSSNPRYNVDYGQRDVLKSQPLANGEMAEQTVPPTFRIRGQAVTQATATIAAAAASGTVEPATLSLPAGYNYPEWCEVVLINESDTACDAVVYQTVNNFVSGSGTVLVPVSGTISLTASGGVDQELLHFPFTSDGPLVVQFTTTAVATNGGNVGAQLRFM